MKKEELIAQCRYYHGEKTCPYQTAELSKYWEMERIYVNQGTGKEDKVQDTYYKFALHGKDYPGIPRALLITMFSYWEKGTYDVLASMPEFQKLIDGYLRAASDHIPMGTVPDNG